jgi:hypothetical protein
LILLENDVQSTYLLRRRSREANDDLNSKRRRIRRPVSGAATASNAMLLLVMLLELLVLVDIRLESSHLLRSPKFQSSREALWVLQNHCLPDTADVKIWLHLQH